ncbi:MAG: quinate 5-dehydrogenase [Bacillota bacterium]|uniref:hypothetical protein n=1 Tax=Desulfurispora thermophila TaxID=265470 RepID=UPI000380273A|nr:hypothetical protein [Desulfurispora thermophila]
MKKVVSISLGSARRDHEVTVELLGQTFCISRRGTDGDFERAYQLLRELDGRVDAIGLGGIDVYLRAGDDCYVVQDGLRLLQTVKETPVVDGSGLKNTLERQVAYYLREHTNLLPSGCRVLMVSAVDRFGMAEAFSQLACDVTFGDLIFAAGIPYPIKTMDELKEIARKTLPEMCKLPFHMLYPTGKKQETQDEAKIEKFGHYYHQAQVIAGDFHLIRRYMPHDLQGQTVITNTTTAEDVEFLRHCGVGTLVTTTPEFNGRSFGTNVLEAVLVVLLNKPVAEIVEQDYLELLDRLNFRPRVLGLN